MTAQQIERILELNESQRNDPSLDFMRLPGTNFVPGHGPMNPKIMVIGEAPGELENLRRIPFMGRAGINLMQIFAKIGLDLEDVYLTNAVKYRPMDQFEQNRTPTPEEMAASQAYLLAEIEYVNPVVVGLAGKVPFRTVFPREDSPRGYGDFSKIHGTLLNNRYVPLYHPAVLTYRPAQEPLMLKGYEKLKQYAGL